MLDINFIRENKELIKKNIINRNMDVDVDKLLDLDEQRRNSIQQIDELRKKRNDGSKTRPTDQEIQKMREVSDQIKILEQKQIETISKYDELIKSVPNIAHQDVPIGGEKDYTVIEYIGKAPNFSFVPKNHEELMENLGLVDFERGAKVTGSKFYFVKGDLVRLNFALIQYGIEILTNHGFELVETPDIAKHEILEGTGYNPRGEESQIYSIEGTDLGLIGTAEITMGGYHQNEILDLKNGPKKYAAFSHCFRREAGAYGKASKGLYRVHQFPKLEMFIYCKPEDSEKMHSDLLEIEKEICNGLGLCYRIIDTPTGDLGAPAYRKYDIEAFMTLNNEYDGDWYGEITSTSNCTDYQARRLNIRYKDENGKNQYVHTLNGTAIALSRLPIAIFEQFQQEDGSIDIPEALIKFFWKYKIS